MRIVHLTWEFPPLVYGGIARHVAALAQHQAAAGHDVTVITQQPPGAPSLERVGGVTVVRVPHDPPRLPFAADTVVAWVAGLNAPLARALVRQPRTDVVHAHDWVVASAAAMAVDGLGLPLVSTFHATEAGRHGGWVNGPTSIAVHQAEAWLAAMSSQVIACSAATAGEVATLFGADAAVIPNGIDLAAWPQRQKAPRNRVPVVLFVGRLEWEKGVFDLLEAVAGLRCRLRLVGTGGQVEQVRRRAGRTVQLVGRVPPEQVRAEYAGADVVVVPSRYEPFGLTALEAMATGVPLVVTDTGGLADIAAGGRRAVVVPPGDPAALAAALAGVLADPSTALARAAAAREDLATDFAWPDIARSTVAVYERAVPRALPAGWTVGDPFAEPDGPPPPSGRLLPG